MATTTSTTTTTTLKPVAVQAAALPVTTTSIAPVTTTLPPPTTTTYYPTITAAAYRPPTTTTSQAAPTTTTRQEIEPSFIEEPELVEPEIVPVKKVKKASPKPAKKTVKKPAKKLKPAAIKKPQKKVYHSIKEIKRYKLPSKPEILRVIKDGVRKAPPGKQAKKLKYLYVWEFSRGKLLLVRKYGGRYAAEIYIPADNTWIEVKEITSRELKAIVEDGSAFKAKKK